MAKKREVAKKKDEHENRNAVIAGFLLVVATFIVVFLRYWASTGLVNYAHLRTPIFESIILEAGLRLSIFALAYLILGAVLYIVSPKFETKYRIRFWAKSIFIGGIICMVLAILSSILISILTPVIVL